MQPRFVSTLLSAISLATIACEHTPTEVAIADHVIVATNRCGAADGPAVELYVIPPANSGDELPPSASHFRIVIPTTRIALRSFSMPITNGSTAQLDDATASRCSSNSDCQFASTGAIKVSSASDDGPLDVELHMLFANDQSLTIHRTADWRPRSIRCG